MVNLDQKLCFLECLSLCRSGSEVGKRKLYELWKAEVNPPCSEYHCRLEAMKDRHRGARAFQFVLELFHCVSTPPSRLPALLTNTSPPSRILAAGNTCLPDSPASPHSPKPVLLSDYSLMLQQPLLNPYILSFFPYCISPHSYNKFLPP